MLGHVVDLAVEVDLQEADLILQVGEQRLRVDHRTPTPWSPRAVIVAEIEETVSVLADAEALADIREADAAYASGDVVRGAEAVRGLRRDG